LAHQSGKPLISMRAAPESYGRTPDDGDRLAVALAIAKGEGGVLFIDECDQFFNVRNGEMTAPDLLTVIERATGLIVLATNRPLRLSEALDRRVLYRFNLPIPTGAHAAEIWRRHIPAGLGTAAGLPEDLASRFVLTGGHIKNAVLVAIQALVTDGGERCSPDDATAALEVAAGTQMRRIRRQCGAFEPLDIRQALVPCGTAAGAGRDVDDAASLLRGAVTVADRMCAVPPLLILVCAPDLMTAHNLSRAIARRAGARGLVRLSMSELAGAQGSPEELDRLLRYGASDVPLLVSWTVSEKGGPTPASLERVLAARGIPVILACAVQESELLHWLPASDVVVRADSAGSAFHILRALFAEQGVTWRGPEPNGSLRAGIEDRRRDMGRVVQLSLRVACGSGRYEVTASDVEWALNRLERNLPAPPKPVFGFGKAGHSA